MPCPCHREHRGGSGAAEIRNVAAQRFPFPLVQASNAGASIAQIGSSVKGLFGRHRGSEKGGEEPGMLGGLFKGGGVGKRLFGPGIWGRKAAPSGAGGAGAVEQEISEEERRERRAAALGAAERRAAEERSRGRGGRGSGTGGRGAGGGHELVQGWRS